MNGYASHQDGLKRRWEEKGSIYCSRTPLYTRFLGGNGGAGASPMPASSPRKLLGFSALDDDLASTVIPPVTVVLEGRSICHRISLHKHASYESLALALRRMFVDTDDASDGGTAGDVGTTNLDLSNAVPGYMVAYEDMEDDLLLAGDLNWKDFVRVAKRIRIIPVKANRKNTSGGVTNAVKVSL